MGGIQSKAREFLKTVDIEAGLNEEQLQEIWKLYDKDNDGKLNKKEAIQFFQAYSKAQKQTATKKACEALFDRFDLNKDGYIELSELSGQKRKPVKEAKRDSKKAVNEGTVDPSRFIDVSPVSLGMDVDANGHVKVAVSINPQPDLTFDAAARRIQSIYRIHKMRRMVAKAVLTEHNALQEALYGPYPRQERKKWRELLSAPLAMPKVSNARRRSSAMIGHSVMVGNFDAVTRNVSVDTTITCFVSSTFTDTKLERDMLISDVYPYLNRLAAIHGLQFIPSEMRWGIRQESSNAHRTSEICMTELGRCQDESLGVNYVFLAGNKYGFRPFPAAVNNAHFELLLERIPNKEDAALVREWYALDENTLPALQRLKPISSETSGTWWGANGAEGVFFRIQRYLRAAAGRVLEEATKGDATPSKEIAELARQFEISVTHDEVHNGLLDLDPRTREKKVFMFQRDLGGLEGMKVEGHKALSPHLFYDMAKGKLDDEAQLLNEKLKDKVRGGLPPERVAHARLNGAVLDPRRKDHKEYLREFCDRFCSIMCDSILAAAIRMKSNTQDETYSEVVAHNVVCRDKASQFQGQEKLLADLAKYVTDDTPSICVMWGGSGCGKSSAMAKAAYDVYKTHISGKGVGTDEEPVPAAIIRFLGTSVGSFGVLELLTSLCQQLDRLYPVSLKAMEPADRAISPDFQKLQSQFHGRLKWATKARPLVLFLDSCDQLSDRNGGRSLRWLPTQLPPHVRLIVSTLPKEGGCLAALRAADASDQTVNTRFLEVPRLSKEDSTSILDSWLEGDKRLLSTQQRDIVFEGFEECPLPLYLRLAYDVSRTWTSTHMADKLLGSVRGLIGVIFDALETTHGSLLVSHALSAMTAAHHGLSDGQMQDFLSVDDVLLDDVFEWWTPPIRRVPPLLWTRLRSDLREYVVDRGVMGVAVHSWYHRQFWELAEDRYLGTEKEQKRCHQALAEYFSDMFVDGKAIHNHVGGTVLDRKLTPLMDVLTGLFRNMWAEPVAGASKAYTPNAPGFVQRDSVPASRKHATASVLTHLVKSGNRKGAQDRLLCLDWLSTYLEAHSSLALLDEMDLYLSEVEDGDVRLVSAAMKLSGPKLSVSPSQLYEQLSLRLRNASKDSPRLAKLLDQDRWTRMGWEASARKDRGMPLLFPANPWDPETAQAGGFMMLRQEYSARFDCVIRLPQSNRLAAGADDGSVVIYDATNGDLVAQLLGPNTAGAYIKSLAVSHDGKRIASGDTKGLICLFEVDTGKLLLTIKDTHDGKEVNALCFLEDGRIVSGGQDCKAAIYNGATLEHTLEGHVNTVSALHLIPKGIMSVSLDGSVKTWDLQGKCLFTGGEVKTEASRALQKGDETWHDSGLMFFQRRWSSGVVLETVGDSELIITDAQWGEPLHVAYCNCKPRALPKEATCLAVGEVDGRRVFAVGFFNGSVELWDAESAERMMVTEDKNPHLLCVAISPCGKYLLGGGAEKVLAIWSVETGKLLRQMEGHTSYLTGLLVWTDQADGKALVCSVSLDRCIIEWDLQKCVDFEAPPLGHDSYVYDLDMSDDGSRAITTCMEGSIVVWDAKSGAMLNRMVRKGVLKIALSNDGTQFITGCNTTGVLELYDFDGQTAIRSFATDLPKLDSLRFEGDTVSVVGMNSCVNFQVSTGKMISRIEHTHNFLDSTLLADERTVFASDNNGLVHLLDVAEGKLTRTFPRAQEVGDVRCEISPNGAWIVTTHNLTKCMSIQNAKTGEVVHKVPDCHSHSLYSPSWSVDSRYAIIGGADEKLTMWSAETGECTLRMAAPSHCVFTACRPGWYVIMVGGKEVTGFEPWIPLLEGPH